jgi:aspartate/methionine/tyrosine aminotransferase
VILPGRLNTLPPSSFAKLATLLDNVAPGAEPISLAVGDPHGEVPAFVMESIARHAHRFGEYPPIQGTVEWRQAAAGWLKRRFGVELDSDNQVLPLNGTREGLFLAPFIVAPESKAGARPVILLPNPFYQCYAAAVLACGAEPVFVRADAANGFLPDYAGLPKAILERTAAAYLCSPSNPEGACADETYWRTLFALADEYGFTVFADECYADIYLETPPTGALTVRGARSERLLTFHSLSKRSGLPGLRSGIVAGDGALMAKFRAFRNYAGPQVPWPIVAASATAWGDEAHVAANRARYAERFRAAERILGHRTRFRLPMGGFFLWLDVGDGESSALRLWREAGVRVLPGSYMGRENEPGKSRTNPGFAYIRVALVNDLSTIIKALERMGNVLSGDTP